MEHIKRIDEMVSQKPYSKYESLPRTFMCGDVEFEKSEDLDTFNVWYGAWDVQIPNIFGKHHLCVRIVELGSLKLWIGEIDSKIFVDRTGKPITFSTPEEMAYALMNAKENELLKLNEMKTPLYEQEEYPVYYVVKRFVYDREHKNGYWREEEMFDTIPQCENYIKAHTYKERGETGRFGIYKTQLIKLVGEE